MNKKIIVFIVALLIGFGLVFLYKTYFNSTVQSVEFNINQQHIKQLTYNKANQTIYVSKLMKGKTVKTVLPFTQSFTDSILNITKTKIDSLQANFITINNKGEHAFYKTDSLATATLTKAILYKLN